MSDALRGLPSVDAVASHPGLAHEPNPAVRTEAARTAIEQARTLARTSGHAPELGGIVDAAIEIVRRLRAPSLRPVINATGVILHTNLGRAPLSDAALAAMHGAGLGYSNLEYDLESGARGSRFSHLDELLRRVTGAEAGIAVNNNASAILLMLSALCRDREVIVSRGQAVEIGGGFRIPDVLRQSGATLIEVGTTNRTTLRDFEAAITERTAAILRVHASNFRIIGFTSFPELEELAALARARSVLLLDDLGSGCLVDTRRFGMLPEPTVQESVRWGVDVIAFSGDKLLGGPQAGVLAGRKAHVDAARRHPLARAVRMDKIGIAALAATLQHYALGEEFEAIPVWRMIAMPLSLIEQRAAAWQRSCRAECSIVPSRSVVGGGSLPGEGVETRVLAVKLESPDTAANWLRRRGRPIVARIEDGLLLLDPRTVDPRDDAEVAQALTAQP